MKKLNIPLVLLFICHSVFSQPGTASLPVVTAPSPKATMMNRFGNYPVSLYTGLVDVTIPVFEININGIKVPVEFRYHASGLKYDDHPMELGYGWTLKAGGTISNSYRGTPIGKSFSGSGQRANPYDWVKDINYIDRYLSTAPGISDNDQTRLTYINNGAKYPISDPQMYYADSEYDVFDYNFLHHTGQFYYLDGSIIKVPANGLNVSTVMGLGTVVDYEGVVYFFTKMDEDDYGFNPVWYLTKIISANKADTVTFDYTVFPRTSAYVLYKPVIDQRHEHKHTIYGDYNLSYVSNEWQTTGSGKIYKSFYPPRLNNIKYRGGKIDFIYTNTTTSRNLSEIKIYDHRNNLFRTVKLLKPRTDWLDGIEFRDNANAVQQTYAFEYNGTPDGNPGMDYWGYYNGSQAGSGYIYIPNFSYYYTDNGKSFLYTISGMNRTPNLFYMQQGILTKIVYPTKGYTVFEYEAHKADNQIYGGLRIKEIRSYHHDNTLLEKKWYKYGTGENGNGRAAIPVNYTSSTIDIARFYREYRILENSNSGIYNKYTTKYFYPFPLTSYFTSGSSVVYTEVAEYSGTGSVSNGKTVYKYSDTPDETSWTMRYAVQPQKFKSWQWKNGLLLSKDIYNSSNQKVYSLTNTYSDLLTSQTLNLGVMQYADIVDVVLNGFYPQLSSEYVKNNLNDIQQYVSQFASELWGTLYDYYNYYITTGIPVITTSIENLDGVTTTTTYSGHNNIGLPAQKQVINSNSDNMITKYKYPTDLSSTAPYNSMVGNNILTPVIHEEQYKGTTFLSKSVNEYKNWGSNMYEPEILKLQATSGGALENRIIYHNRDPRGNPRYISKDDADHVVYLWGYNSLYPIAEIIGVPLSAVTPFISEISMNTIGAKDEPSSSDFTTINNLRSQLPNALVTTYTYKPLVGVATMTDPRGVETVFYYDNFGRLSYVTRANRVEEMINYNFK